MRFPFTSVHEKNTKLFLIAFAEPPSASTWLENALFATQYINGLRRYEKTYMDKFSHRFSYPDLGIRTTNIEWKFVSGKSYASFSTCLSFSK